MPSLYKALYCTLLFTHNIQTIQSFFLSLYIVNMVSEPLLWPSGIFMHSSATLAFTGSHCQKRVTVVKPNHYLSNLVYSSIKSSNHNYNMIDQTSPIKTQPKTVPKELSCAAQVFVCRKRATRAFMRLTSRRHALIVVPRATHAQLL